MITFETYRKRGRGWEYLGTQTAESSRGAALMTSYVHNIKVVGIRVADTPLKMQVFRFKYVAMVQDGR